MATFARGSQDAQPTFLSPHRIQRRSRRRWCTGLSPRAWRGDVAEDGDQTHRCAGNAQEPGGVRGRRGGGRRTNADWLQRVVLTANGLHEEWIGRGEGNHEIGSRLIRLGTDVPDTSILVAVYHSQDGGATWIESSTARAVEDQDPASAMFVGGEDGGDRDYNDAIVAFSWFNVAFAGNTLQQVGMKRALVAARTLAFEFLREGVKLKETYSIEVEATTPEAAVT